MIHPTAIIKNSTIGKDCYIGPYCVVQNCDIGDNTKLSSHVAIGGAPEMLTTRSQHRVKIGSNNLISEFVTIHCGETRDTIIEDFCMIQRHAHIAHDCHVHSGSIIGGGAMLGGFVKILEKAWVCGGATVHQYVVVGRGAFIGPQAHITRHVAPFMKIAARASAYIGDNNRQKEGLSSKDIIAAQEEFEAAFERKDPTNARQENSIFQSNDDHV
jgi:UDP-N-acetylglucosamine acyltransferase